MVLTMWAWWKLPQIFVLPSSHHPPKLHICVEAAMRVLPPQVKTPLCSAG